MAWWRRWWRGLGEEEEERERERKGNRLPVEGISDSDMRGWLVTAGAVGVRGVMWPGWME